VNQPGDDFLPYSTLSSDEDLGVGAGSRPNIVAQCLDDTTVSNEPKRFLHGAVLIL
jgi:hypothetical protein